MDTERDLEYFETRWDAKWESERPDMKESWDKRSDDWDAKYRDGSGRKQQSEQRILDTAQFLRTEGFLQERFDVADVGCGPGRFVAEFAKTARSALGIDISPKMAAYGEAYAAELGLKNVSFIAGDFHKMDLGAMGLEGKYDLVFSSITPAVGGLSGLDNLIAMSRKWCCNVCFVHYENDLNDRILHEVFSLPPRDSKTGHSEWFWEMFNVLYLRGYYPEVSYYKQPRQIRQPADRNTAEYLAWYLLPGADNTEKSARRILDFLEAHADPDGMTLETSDCWYARTVWDVRDRHERKHK